MSGPSHRRRAANGEGAPRLRRRAPRRLGGGASPRGAGPGGRTVPPPPPLAAERPEGADRGLGAGAARGGRPGGGLGSSLTGVGRVGLGSLSEVTGAAFAPRDGPAHPAGDFKTPSHAKEKKKKRTNWCLLDRFFSPLRFVVLQWSFDFLFWSLTMQQLEVFFFSTPSGRAAVSEAQSWERQPEKPWMRRQRCPRT